MRRFLTGVLSIVLFSVASAQEPTNTLTYENSEGVDTIRYTISNSFLEEADLFNDSIYSAPYTTPPKPYTVNVEAGTSVSTNFNGGFGTNVYVAPIFSLKPNDKWRIDIAPSIGRSYFDQMPVWLNPWGTTTLDGSYTHLSIYSQATYWVNEKVFVGGTISAEAMLASYPQMNPEAKNLKDIGASMFVGYKFSDNFSMSAEFGVRKNNYGFGMPGQSFGPGPMQGRRHTW